ncbi:helix-turn-helix domain-containing protein [Aquamicrobium sp. NLF2-7]|uniref:helix-turn-helix domain-containing protein n=1 Tax=unclassified Aquamicrobium TaxID=2618194 RepID=UPI001EFB5C30|nr:MULTISPECIES: helix-turn-helix domain-containing protein [unclassified Aquamicrobium]MCG8272644.1 helix-turn-helix domain-containing protein [Aquamicrobium sp. NLF2-7]MCK9552572.1 helix-turn-helix domain-containing protein [Aquamicrobium sp.]
MNQITLEVPPVFRTCLRLMDTLVAQFGTNCQVSLYDTRAGGARLIAVAGSVMEVAIGSRLPASIVSKLEQASRANTGKTIFTSSTPDGRRLSSSLSIIDDPETGQPVGCMKIDFCIEHLMTSIDVLQTFCNYEEPKAAAEGPVEDIGELVDTIIADALRNQSNPRSVTGKAHRMEIVRRLDERGVFLVKGSVDIVSTKLNISKYTIYNYLDQIKKGGGGHAQS